MVEYCCNYFNVNISRILGKDGEVVLRIVELKEEFMGQLSSAECWQ